MRQSIIAITDEHVVYEGNYIKVIERTFFNISYGDGRNPSPSGEEKIMKT